MDGYSYDPGLFDVDGSLRDVCVLNTGLRDWELVLSALANKDWGWTLEVGPEPAPENSAHAIFDHLNANEDASARLAVRVGSIWFTSYFFDPSEVEFTFDPSEILGEPEFGNLVGFMTWMATTCRKPVILTMESSNHASIPPLLTVEVP